MPLAIELVEQKIEVIPTPQQSPASEVPTVDKGMTVYVPAPTKKPNPPTKLKGIVIGAPTSPDNLIEEDEPISTGDDTIHPSAGGPAGLTKEEQLPLTLKALH